MTRHKTSDYKNKQQKANKGSHKHSSQKAKIAFFLIIPNDTYAAFAPET
jgi:hypothetical protein